MAAFFTSRLNSNKPSAPLGGIDLSGWRLVYTDEMSHFLRDFEDYTHTIDLSASIGIKLKMDGSILDVVPSGAAAQAGVGPGSKLVAVNDRHWSSESLRDALKGSRNNSQLLKLLIEDGEIYKTYQPNYHKGEQFPHLERDATLPDLLDQACKPISRANGM